MIPLNLQRVENLWMKSLKDCGSENPFKGSCWVRNTSDVPHTLSVLAGSLRDCSFCNSKTLTTLANIFWNKCGENKQEWYSSTSCSFFRHLTLLHWRSPRNILFLESKDLEVTADIHTHFFVGKESLCTTLAARTAGGGLLACRELKLLAPAI